MPLRDFSCLNCDLAFEDVLVTSNETLACPACGKSDALQIKLSFPSTYTIKGDNSASTRPKKGQ